MWESINCTVGLLLDLEAPLSLGWAGATYDTPCENQNWIFKRWNLRHTQLESQSKKETVPQTLTKQKRNNIFIKKAPTYVKKNY